MKSDFEDFDSRKDVASPNDPKLSDGGGWRDGCTVGERRRLEAGAVTHGAVRCSAWFGDIRALLTAAQEAGKMQGPGCGYMPESLASELEEASPTEHLCR